MSTQATTLTFSLSKAAKILERGWEFQYDSVSLNCSPYQLEWKIPIIDTSELVESLNIAPLSDDSDKEKVMALFKYFSRTIYNKTVEVAEKISTSTIIKINTHFNDVLAQDTREISKLQEELEDTREAVMLMTDAMQYQKNHIDNLKQTVTDFRALLTSYQKQVNDLPVDAGSQRGRAKIPDPLTFTDSESKQNLKMWVNQINLYAAHTEISTDKQKIVLALIRLWNSTAKYIGDYFKKLSDGSNLGFWKNFKKKLNDITNFLLFTPRVILYCVASLLNTSKVMETRT